MRDFTLILYKNLLEKLLAADYHFLTFRDYMNGKESGSVKANKILLLRHDVDLLPQNSFQTAQIEHSLGIRGTYYFRIVPQSFNVSIIHQIADLGHEIGYHYEDLTLAKGNVEKAIKSFEQNLSKLRKIVPVTTACMHGSPRSPWDSKDLWKKYNYRDYGIIGEPYIDIDFSKVLYLTDTGRRWDGEKVSVRDKVSAVGNLTDLYKFHSTSDIIRAAENHSLPNQIMITIHPQRWTDKPLPWLRELLMQSAKNVIKRWFFVR